MYLIRKINLLLILGILIASVFFLVNRVIWQNLFVFSNSDLLYIPSFLKDFWEGHYNWQKWTLPPSPYLFPDLFISFIISFFSSSLFFLFFIYSVLYSFALVFFIAAIVKLTDQYFSFIRILRATSLFMTLWLALISRYPEDLGLFIFPSYHGGSFLLGLVLYLLIFKISDKKKVFLFIFLSTFAILSDKQIIYSFFIPFIMAGFVLRASSNENYSLKSFLYLLTSLLLSSLILKILLALNIFAIPTIPIWKEIKLNILELKAIQNIKETYPIVKLFFVDFYLDKPLLFILFCVSIPLNVYNSLKISKNKFEIRFFSLYVLFVYFSLIFSQMFFGVWGGARYVWGIYFFPYVSLCTYFGNKISQMLSDRNFRKISGLRKYIYLVSKDKFRSSLVFILISLIFVFLIAALYTFKGTSEITVNTPYPVFVNCLDSLKRKYNLSYGLSDYWNAKHLRYLSKEKLILNQVYLNLDKYNWIHNNQWYEKDLEGNSPIRYNFIITERLDPNDVIKKIGKPTIVEKCEGKEVYIYQEGFKFN